MKINVLIKHSISLFLYAKVFGLSLLFYLIFTPSHACALTTSGTGFSLVENVGGTYYNTFTFSSIDSSGNVIDKNYGLLFKTSSGSTVSSIASLITNYTSSNFAINTNSGAYSFSVNNTNYYITNAYGSALSATNNRNNRTASLFVGNSASSSNSTSPASGGAITNSGTLASISGDFIGNFTTNSNHSTGNVILAIGGAISNTGTINSISGNFIANYAENTNAGTISTNSVLGGAIYNSNTIGSIKGNFIGNSTISGANARKTIGGAIYNGYDYSSSNTATIDSIIADFTGNSADFGGAIFNGAVKETNKKVATIKSISGTFTKNTAVGNQGGAIYNAYYGSIGSISGAFIANTSNTGGGAISNSRSSTIGSINASFINNSSVGHGGALHNTYTSNIGSITGDFINNSAYNPSAATIAKGADGGAIYNVTGTVNSINGNYIGNTAQSDGGAIYNASSVITSINANFSGNSASTTVGYGGALYNYTSTTSQTSSIGTLNGSFVKNTAYYGGALYNGLANIGTINASFYENEADVGGAIYNSFYSASATGNASITSITGDFVGNTAKGTGGEEGAGGAIVNVGGDNKTLLKNVSIGSITGDFKNNEAEQHGGAIFNHYATINTIQSDFTANSSGSNGGALSSTGSGSKITQIISVFLNNSSKNGGAIYNGNASHIASINATFTGNSATNGGAIFNTLTNGTAATITNLSANFNNNTATNNGGAIFNDSNITTISGSFTNNSAANGGGIYNTGTINNISASFTNNSASTSGGAIYNTNTGTINFVANNTNYSFTGNYTGTSSAKEYNAIFNEGIINFTMSGSGSFTLNDSITGSGTTNINGADANNNLFTLNAGFANAIIADKTTLRLGSYMHDNGSITSALSLTNGTLEVNNGILKINGSGYGSDKILDGVNVTGTNSQFIAENIAKGIYQFGTANNTNYWTADNVFTGNTLQTIVMRADEFEIDIVKTSILYEGPMGDIIKEAAFSAEFGDLTNSLLSSYLANTTDFIYGGTNSLVGTAEQQAAFIEGSAKLSSVVGVNATTLQNNRAFYDTIALRQVDTKKRERVQTDARTYKSSTKSEDIIIYDANGRIKEEFKTEYELEKSALKRIIEDNNLALWLSPIYNYENVDGMQSDRFKSTYKTNAFSVAMGIDYTSKAPYSRSGLAFGVGKGRTESSKDYKDISNDFEFISVSIYESLNVYKWLLDANFGYTRLANEIVHDLSSFEMADLFSDVTSFICNLDLNAEYNLIYNTIALSPHIGAELIYLRSNDYTVSLGNSAAHSGGIIYNVGTEAQQILLIPLGIKLEKDFNYKNWSLSPEVDLNFTYALGETEETFFITTSSLSSTATLTGQVLDTYTFGASAKLVAQKNAFGLGAHYNVQKSKNRLAQNINAQIHYSF